MPQAHAHRRAIGSLAALSLLLALGSLRGDLWPAPFRAAAALPPFERQALAWALLALAAAILARIRRLPRLGIVATREAALAGLGLFALPALLVRAAAPQVPDLTRVALFALTPVFCVVLEPYLGAANSARNSLLPVLAALAGVLLVFPVDLPGSLAAALGWIALLLAALSIAAANCRAIATANHLASTARAAVAAAVTAAILGLASLVAEHAQPLNAALLPQALWTLAIDLPALLLLFSLMRRLSAARMTLRFILAPLFASLGGLALALTLPGLRALFGLVLMAAGSAWLLAARDTAFSSSSLHLD